MGHADPHIRNEAVEDIVDRRQFFHLVMEEEDLAAPVQLIIDNALDLLFIEKDDFRLDRNPVRWRRVDDGQVPRPEQRKLQGPGNRRRRPRNA